jgi:hypothetical protein
MNSTRADRVQRAQQLRAALRRTAIDDTDQTPPAPPGDCGRDKSEPCGMRDKSECRTHADVPDDDPELLNYSGTLHQRRQQLKAARRYGLRL